MAAAPVTDGDGAQGPAAPLMPPLREPEDRTTPERTREQPEGAQAAAPAGKKQRTGPERRKPLRVDLPIMQFLRANAADIARCPATLRLELAKHLMRQALAELRTAENLGVVFKVPDALELCVVRIRSGTGPLDLDQELDMLVVSLEAPEGVVEVHATEEELACQRASCGISTAVVFAAISRGPHPWWPGIYDHNLGVLSGFVEDACSGEVPAEDLERSLLLQPADQSAELLVAAVKHLEVEDRNAVALELHAAFAGFRKRVNVLQKLGIADEPCMSASYTRHREFMRMFERLLTRGTFRADHASTLEAEAQEVVGAYFERLRRLPPAALARCPDYWAQLLRGEKSPKTNTRVLRGFNRRVLMATYDPSCHTSGWQAEAAAQMLAACDDSSADQGIGFHV